jgi:membrane-associated phospholipid phosphatase
VGLLLTIVIVGVSVAWLDKPTAFFVHKVFGELAVLRGLTQTPSFFSPLATLVFLIFFGRRLAFRPFGKLDIVLILCDLSIILAKLIVPPLKFAFGRTWPQYNNPSLLIGGVYKFNFFQAGQAFESFPSGHTASICALIVVFWICYPRFRLMYAAVIAAMAGGLIAGNYHFVSDVIAGGFVGCSTAVLMVSIWEAWDRRRVQSSSAGMAFQPFSGRRS